jgi:mRNA interferase MazF
LVCVPIKDYPFEVELSGSEDPGEALADQVKSLDWQSRQAQYKSQISGQELRDIKAKIAALLAFE